MGTTIFEWQGGSTDPSPLVKGVGTKRLVNGAIK